MKCRGLCSRCSASSSASSIFQASTTTAPPALSTPDSKLRRFPSKVEPKYDLCCEAIAFLSFLSALDFVAVGLLHGFFNSFSMPSACSRSWAAGCSPMPLAWGSYWQNMLTCSPVHWPPRWGCQKCQQCWRVTGSQSGFREEPSDCLPCTSGAVLEDTRKNCCIPVPAYLTRSFKDFVEAILVLHLLAPGHKTRRGSSSERVVMGSSSVSNSLLPALQSSSSLRIPAGSFLTAGTGSRDTASSQALLCMEPVLHCLQFEPWVARLA